MVLTAQLECNYANANIAIARRWLSKPECSANLVACIPHVVAKMFLTHVAALGCA